MSGAERMRIGDWIAISRKCADHPIVGMGQPVRPADPTRGSFSRYEAWHFLLFQAAWRERQVANKGRVIMLRRGELMAARAWLAERWNWSVKTVRHFLDSLEQNGMVKAIEPRLSTDGTGQQKGTRHSNMTKVLSISNYTLYQTIYELDELLVEQQRGQRGASEGPHINKETNKQNTTATARDMPAVMAEIENAAGAALADKATRPDLMHPGIPRFWLDQGCDLAMDILPTIRRLCQGARPRSIGTWRYFTNAVIEAKNRRTAPITVPVATVYSSGPPGRIDYRERERTEDRKRKQEEDAFWEKYYAG